jgi:Putative binding domain, N-terminal
MRQASVLLLLAAAVLCAADARAQACTYSVTPTEIDIPWRGGLPTPFVTVTTAPGCVWRASEWFFGGTPLPEVAFLPNYEPVVTRTGPGKLEFMMFRHNGYGMVPLRIAGQMVIVRREPPPCTWEIHESGADIAMEGGSHQLWVYGDCGWTAASHASWIGVSRGASGSASGPIVLAIEPNDTGAPRAGTLTIAGPTYTHTYTVSQSTCARLAPVQMAPGASALVTSPVRFTWTAAVHASSYGVFVTDRNGVTRQLSSTADTSATAELPAGAYTWYVEAYSQACPSTITARGAFTVAPARRRSSGR